MTIETVEFVLPAHWASALINCDLSGYEVDDLIEIATWEVSHPEIGACHGCSDWPEFRRFHDAPEVLPCDCLTFTFPLLRRA
jgi:hypothetical protein